MFNLGQTPLTCTFASLASLFTPLIQLTEMSRMQHETVITKPTRDFSICFVLNHMLSRGYQKVDVSC